MTEEPPCLFEVDDASRPLADRLRPRTLADVVGQGYLLAEDAPIGRMVGAHRLLWGPPGCGKTTITRLLTEKTNLAFEPLSATFSGVADLRKVFQAAQRRRRAGSARCCSSMRSTGSTAPSRTRSCPMSRTARSCSSGRRRKNPSFELNGALLSRSHVFILKRPDATALGTLIGRAETLLGGPLLPRRRRPTGPCRDG